MLNELQQKPEPRRQHTLVVPTRKRQQETDDIQIRIEKREGRDTKRKKKKSASTPIGNTRILQACNDCGGGGVAQRRNNRKTESATRESRETKRNARKAIQESDKKTTKRKDKTSFKQCETTRKQQSSWGKPNACTT